jgi:3-deoxy-D-manno-octulosonate 8-phosphate phosphatase (KDO 8-P phosphatase)
MTGLNRLAGRIRLAIFDVDGVFTDGRLFFTSEGEEIKVFSVRDGLGVKRLQAAGVEVAVISGRASDALTLRMEELGISRHFQGDHDKLPLLRSLLEDTGVSVDEVAYMGDDLPDLAVMKEIALPAAPADAVEEVLNASRWVSTHPGGRGAVREFCEYIVAARADGSEDPVS